MWSKFGIKKEPQRVYNTLRLNGSNIVFFVRHGFVSLKKAKSADCIFFCTQKPVFEKARKTEIVKTTGRTGGLHSPYKGLIQASSLKGTTEV